MAVRLTTVRRLVALLVVVVVTAAIAACGPPDRSKEANELRDTLASMPGVDAVDMFYSHDFTAGYTVSLDVDMPAASTAQVGDVTSTIGAAKADSLEEYGVTVDIVVDEHTAISMWTTFDPEWAATRAGLARDLHPVIGNVTLDISDGVTSFGRVEVHDPSAIVRDVVQVAGDIPLVGSLQVDEGGVRPGWSLGSPTTDAAVVSAQRVVAGLSTVPEYVEIDGVGISLVRVEVPEDPAAYDTLVALASELDAAQLSPMTLKWTLTSEHGMRKESDQEWEGSTRVGDCGELPTFDTEYLTPAAKDIQQRVRKALRQCK
ncbi:hypothetical protein L5G32_13460 [Gordonia sp. HY002]|uniref:hypothetical protein n=1 Tax=Gordonia zhenghanii TaxID=2911516 RepID=UPI001EEFE816|nr:hypothetical protein [Gordonia zhenghanii]MCF8571275.1 hypothetical protein [Gordonia zhenghanii]MCF8601799.1 hypothetical protein [Gordonia zhenghanii]